MKITSLFSQSFRSIFNNKIRSGLTVLGIVIGIAAVITLVGLGKGLQDNVTTRIGGLGSTRITIRSQDPERQTAQRQQGPGGGGGGFNFQQSGNTTTLMQEDYEKIKTISGISLASPELSTQSEITLTADATEATAYQTYGVDSSYFQIQKYEVTSGSLFTTNQINSSESVVILGEQAAKEIFTDSTDPVGQKIYIKDKEFTVVATLKEPEDASPFNNPANNIFLGYKSWLALNEKTKFSTLIAETKNEELVDASAAEIKSSLLSSHNQTEDKADFAISTSKDLLNTISGVASSFTTTLAGIAAISLLVGGIGIMNIMLVTVTERTREIGLRRAVGAKTRHILLQFLTEALMLTLLGGILGLSIGVMFGQNAGNLLQFGPGNAGADTKVVIDLQTALLAVGISTAIGIIFGMFPAVKAARLDPIEALHYE